MGVSEEERKLFHRVHMSIYSSASDLQKLIDADRRAGGVYLNDSEREWYMKALAYARSRELRRGFWQRTIDATRAFVAEWVRKDG